MTYNLGFELMSLVLQIFFLLAYLVRPRLQTRRSKVFLLLLCVLMATTCLDLVTATFINIKNSGIPLACAYTANVLYFISAALLCSLLLYYIKLFLRQGMRFKYYWRLFALFPLAVLALLSATSPWTQLIFYYDAQGVYRYGPLHILTYMLPAFYVLVGGINLMRCSRRIEKSQLSILILCVVSTAGSLLIQALWLPGVLLCYFGCTVAVLLLYIMVEAPDIYIDRKTGLFNREAFSHVLQDMLQQNRPFRCNVFFIPKLATFSKVYGEENSDALLAQLGAEMNRLASSWPVFYLPPQQIILLDRSGGDKLPRKISDRCEQSWRLPDMTEHLYVVRAEFSCPQECDDVNAVYRTLATLEQEVLRRQDHTARMLRPADNLQQDIRRDVKIEQELEYALATESLVVYLQPVFSVEKQRIVSAEALVRLQSEELGLLPPDSFLPIAARNGSMVQLGEQVFAKVCGYAARSGLFNMGIESLQINLSPTQCACDDHAQRLIAIADQYGIPMHRLWLEYVESAEDDPTGAVQRNIDMLRTAGAEFALDDYGTGYSNLNRINEYGIEVVKLDKSLVWSYCRGESRSLQYIVPMFKADGKRIVAEGIETSAQAQALSDLGCDFLQGYCYARPMPMEEFLPYIRLVQGC